MFETSERIFVVMEKLKGEPFRFLCIIEYSSSIVVAHSLIWNVIHYTKLEPRSILKIPISFQVWRIVQQGQCRAKRTLEDLNRPRPGRFTCWSPSQSTHGPVMIPPYLPYSSIHCTLHCAGTLEVHPRQALARSLFWVSRRDRELFSFSLVPRDENEILSTESRASRQDREFCSQNLRPRDEIENFVPQISKFETRSRFFDHFTKTYF